jgi:hypothetical protein
MTPNRIVAILTPLVFAPVAGGAAAWLAEHFPGTEVDPERLTEIFIAGALIALAPALQWLHGWQKHEQREADASREADLAEAGAAGAVGIEELDDEEFLDDFELPFDDEELDDLAEFEELEDPEGAEDEEAVPAGS